MISSFFKGLSALYDRKPDNSQATQDTANNRMYIAEVVDSILRTDHPKYTSQDSIGAVIVRDIEREKNKQESEIDTLAYPIDITDTKIPLPGEFVLVMRGVPSDFLSGVDVGAVDVYIKTISNLGLINYNGIPFGGTTPTKIAKSIGDRASEFLSQLSQRHIARFNTFIQRQIKRLRPYDGDTILQGRFGNSIRLGSTVRSPQEDIYGGSDSVNTTTWSSAGVSGDPITIIRTAQPEDIKIDFNNPNIDQFTVEDINRDGSSVYLCQNQSVPLNVNIASSGFKTWRKDLGIKPTANNTNNQPNPKLQT